MKKSDHSANVHRATHAMNHYPAFGVMMVLGTVIMFFVMYEMIAGWQDFRLNLNMAYMALTMAAPMAILELALMRHMYPNTKLNLAIYAVSLIILVGSFFAVRYQTGIDDKQFLTSMIPHHSGAILMCEEASLTYPELKDLCTKIIQSQRDEIEQMKRILERM